MKHHTTIALSTTAQPMASGADAVQGIGQDNLFSVVGSWNFGDMISLYLTDTGTGYQTMIGAGNVTGVQFTYVTTFNNKVYGLGGTSAYFSAIGQPTVWNDPNAAGNGFITMSDFYATQQNLMAIAPYQGKLLFVARSYVQVWNVDPDPANYALTQTLPNIGTVAPLSVQPVGDMDVYMLADNGVRSVRVRDASNNAIIADIGTPIDAILQPLLAQLTDAQKAASCGVVEPSSNRYWCYIPMPDGSAGKIYVFSYFPSSQIAAWGTYSPTYQAAIASPAANYTASVITYTGLTVGARYAWLPGAHEVSITNGTTVLKGEGAFTATATTATVAGSGATVTFTGALSLTTAFVPTQFVVSKGQVWAVAGTLMLQYGGSANASYDNCGVTFATPYIDSGTPATKKQFTGIDAALQGTWELDAAFDFNVGKYRKVWSDTKPTFMGANIGWQATGTHYSFQCVESGSAYALFSSLMCHQNAGANN